MTYLKTVNTIRRDPRWLIPAAIVSGLMWVGLWMAVASFIRWVL